jgi:hypothetical protein
MARLLLVVFTLSLAACGDQTTVRRGVDNPPPGETQNSPIDGDRQWGERNRDRDRHSS